MYSFLQDFKKKPVLQIVYKICEIPISNIRSVPVQSAAFSEAVHFISVGVSLLSCSRNRLSGCSI